MNRNFPHFSASYSLDRLSTLIKYYNTTVTDPTVPEAINFVNTLAAGLSTLSGSSQQEAHTFVQSQIPQITGTLAANLNPSLLQLQGTANLISTFIPNSMLTQQAYWDTAVSDIQSASFNYLGAGQLCNTNLQMTTANVQFSSQLISTQTAVTIPSNTGATVNLPQKTVNNLAAPCVQLHTATYSQNPYVSPR